MPKKPPRLTYTLRYRAGLWVLIAPDGERVPCRSGNKALAVSDATTSLADAWRFLRIRSELRICDRRGRVVDCRTYGEDPRRTQG